MRVVVAVLFVAGFLSVALAGPMPAPPVLPTPGPEIGFSGGDGSSCRAAVVIKAAREQDGIRAERWWVYTKNPGASVESQSTSNEGGKDFETFTLILADGSRKNVCFDISSFIGKL